MRDFETPKSVNPWKWVPSLYFAEGIPYVIVMSVAVLMYKRLGLSNTDATYYTAWLYLPWVIKPFWSPLVEILRSKRWWIVIMEFLVGISMAGVAFTLPTANWVQWTLAIFWIMAFSSATHDIAADGFYMLGLDTHQQSFFVGVRSTFYRISMMAGQGLFLLVAQIFETRFPDNISKAWAWTLYLTAGLFLLIFLYHYFILPHPTEDNDKEAPEANIVARQFFITFVSFFKKPQILIALMFLLVYRLPEALLVKVCPLFLIDTVEQGGLALSPGEIGLVQGTVGVIGLTLGGIIGGVVVAKDGFKKWLWSMVFAITLPNIVYVFLAYEQPEYAQTFGMLIINICVFIEQFGYGFGFTAYMLFMLFFTQGSQKTAHYAFCTGFMALSMMLPGMVSGWLQEQMDYLNFFIFVIALCPLTFFAAAKIHVDADFGIKKEEEN